jgi:segregation and condensation protein A
MNKESLLSAIFESIKNLPKEEKKPKVKIQKTISLEEMIGNLTERVKSSLKMSFKEFAGMGKVDRVNVIVSFLAMLELVKQGIIDATQNDKYGDIQMETKDVGVPSY